jgi:hypothetical protein
MKLRRSLTPFGLTLILGLAAVASGRAQTPDGCPGATVNRVSEGTQPSAPTVSTVSSRNTGGPQEPSGSQGPRGLIEPQRTRGPERRQAPQRPQGPRVPLRITGPECFSALCG